MEAHKALVPVQLANGVTMQVEATILGGDGADAARLLSFQQVTETIEGIAAALTTVLYNVKPKKACIEFGLEMVVASGQLMALLVKGAGTASLNITLEWGE